MQRPESGPGWVFSTQLPDNRQESVARYRPILLLRMILCNVEGRVSIMLLILLSLTEQSTPLLFIQVTGIWYWTYKDNPYANT